MCSEDTTKFYVLEPSYPGDLSSDASKVHQSGVLRTNLVARVERRSDPATDEGGLVDGVQQETRAAGCRCCQRMHIRSARRAGFGGLWQAGGGPAGNIQSLDVLYKDRFTWACDAAPG
jgi:hypothetical protein